MPEGVTDVPVEVVDRNVGCDVCAEDSANQHVQKTASNMFTPSFGSKEIPESLNLETDTYIISSGPPWSPVVSVRICEN